MPVPAAVAHLGAASRRPQLRTLTFLAGTVADAKIDVDVAFGSKRGSGTNRTRRTVCGALVLSLAARMRFFCRFVTARDTSAF